jgi:hypothetical protein
MFRYLLSVFFTLGCNTVATPIFEPYGEEPERANPNNLPFLCESDLDCQDDDPCVASSRCLPESEYADAHGCKRIHFAKGDACGGSDNVPGSNWGSCQYSTDEHAFGAPVTCTSSI